MIKGDKLREGERGNERDTEKKKGKREREAGGEDGEMEKQRDRKERILIRRNKKEKK